MTYVVCLTSAALLAACEPRTGTLENPRATDRTGRSVVPVTEGVNLFMSACFNSGGSRSGAQRAARRAGYSIEAEEEIGFIAGHKTKALSITQLGDQSCAISFDAGIPNINAGADAAELLIPKIKPTQFGGTRGGGQINFATRKGLVIVGNNARIRLDGASITLVPE